MYGARVVGPHEVRTFTSGAQITKGDLVTQITDGQVEVATGGAGTPGNATKITGVALESVASSGLSVRVAVPLNGGRLRVLMDNDNTGVTFAAASVGKTFDVTGSTGAMLVDTSTHLATALNVVSQQLKAITYNPQGFGLDTDTSIGLFEITAVQ